MENFILPDPQHHKYIVGIDFGHGETSAAICEINWEKPNATFNAGVNDLSINPKYTGTEKVLISAISQVGEQKPQIGVNAFGAEQLQRKASICACFKEPPHSIDGKAESLMISFMKAVYEQILDFNRELISGNHIVYIARPSGWQDETTKELYRQMAVNAGLPLGGLTSESRAGIFYALNDSKVAFRSEINDGAIVFDFGSSTLDFTYIASDQKPVDYGYPHGASMIDRAILNDMIAANPAVRQLLELHPQYESALLLKARMTKEDSFKKNPETPIDNSFMLKTVISRDCPDYDIFKKEFVIIEYNNLDSFVDSFDKHLSYKSKIKEDLRDFKVNHIAGKPIKGVFLTGGASRMGFVTDIICKEYGLQKGAVRMDPDNPSLTISRGIAMLGCADALSMELEKKLRNIVNTIDVTPFVSKFKNEFTKALTDVYWKRVRRSIEKYKGLDGDVNLKWLFDDIERSLMTCDMTSVQKNVLANCIMDCIGVVKNELDVVISLYNPEYLVMIPSIENIQLNIDGIDTDISKAVKSVLLSIQDDMVLTIKELIGDLVLTVIAFLAPWLFWLIKGGQKLVDIIKSDEAKKRKMEEELKKRRSRGEREQLYQGFISNRGKTTKKMYEHVLKSIEDSSRIRKSIPVVFKTFISNYVENNIKNVKIDIE